MITISDLALQYSGTFLFQHVDLQFTAGNCYGVIGANGAGKSTFLKLLSGELDSTKGTISIKPGLRMSVLKQDQFRYDAYTILDTVIMGNQRLYEVGREKEAIYAKEEMTDEDGMLACQLEEEYAELGGWEAESDASRAVRLTPAELEDVLRPAMEYAAANGMEINFTSPGWLPEETLRTLGFTQIPSCGACLSNMAVAPDGTVLPCQSWLTGKGLGNMLRTPWPRIWHSGACRAIRGESAKMERRCQLGATPMQEGC